MNYKEAINASQIWGARGYNEMGVCVVAICLYDDVVMWLPGFDGNWAKDWEELPEDGESKLVGLKFAPTGRKPDDQIAAELLSILGGEQEAPLNKEMREALEEIADEYEYLDEAGEDYFMPMGESYD